MNYSLKMTRMVLIEKSLHVKWPSTKKPIVLEFINGLGFVSGLREGIAYSPLYPIYGPLLGLFNL